MVKCEWLLSYSFILSVNFENETALATAATLIEQFIEPSWLP
jgi:hypothetical protein